MINRRNFLKNASVLTIGGMMASKATLSNAATTAPVVNNTLKKSKKIGLQIYSLGGELKENVPTGMKKLKEMGYETLELAGTAGLSMPEFKKMADDNGLLITSAHVNPPMRVYTKENFGEICDFWKKTADDYAAIGVTYLIQPGQPQTNSVEETKFVCDVFNKAGEIVKAAGVPKGFGYHNHWFEFAKVKDGGTAAVFSPWEKGDVVYDLFLANTDPNKVFYEMDVYWTVMGGNDPLEYMKKYPERIKVLHIKDRKILGQSGMMNFENIFNQHYANGYEDYFVELEGVKDMSQFDGVKDCAAYLLKSSFVK